MEEPPISKRKLKKLKRDQEWEANREQRKARRKEKIKDKKERQRAAQRDGNVPAAGSLLPNPSDNFTTEVTSIHKPLKEKQKTPHPIQLPITIILDCGFDELMIDKEIKSLSAQITRCYSDNHKAPFKAHLAISSFGGLLKERFDSILSGHYSSWKEVNFLESDFYEAAQQAKEWMKRPHGGKLLGALAPHKESPDQPSLSTKGQDQDQEVEARGELVYLTSDSPDTLTELKPYSTYIIGGLVDRNRHKGICYKRAMDRGVKTAKLPIGDYMQMNSRFVLATNHVSEIMLRWLELGNWGKAFLRVIPKRKGGTLKGGAMMKGEEGRETGMENLNNDGGDDDEDCDGEVENEEQRDRENSNDNRLKQTEFGAEIGIEMEEEDTDKHNIHESTQTGVELEVKPPEEDSLSAKQVINNHAESPKEK